MNEHQDRIVPEFTLLSVGLIYASVCSSLSEHDTTERLNLLYPTGLSWSWKPSDEPTFATGQFNPCPCEKKPDTHVHRLYVC